MLECLSSVDKTPALILQEGRERPKRGSKGGGREGGKEGKTGCFFVANGK